MPATFVNEKKTRSHVQRTAERDRLAAHERRRAPAVWGHVSVSRRSSIRSSSACLDSARPINGLFASRGLVAKYLCDLALRPGMDSALLSSSAGPPPIRLAAPPNLLRASTGAAPRL